jgi:hypothetical protein
MPGQIVSSSVVVAASRQVFVEVDGEFIILNTDTGMYYGLEDVGAHLWRQLQQPTAVADLCAAVRSDYDVDAARCERDITALLAQMTTEGLVEVRG